jgi:hypothetical protein
MLGPQCRTVDRIEPYLTLFGLHFAYQHILTATTQNRRLQRIGKPGLR